MDDALLGSIVGDDGVFQDEDRGTAVFIDNDTASGTRGLVVADSSVLDDESAVARKDRAARISAIVGASSSANASCHSIVIEGAVLDDDMTVVTENGAA